MISPFSVTNVVTRFHKPSRKELKYHNRENLRYPGFLQIPQGECTVMFKPPEKDRALRTPAGVGY
ncbi:MAG: hypothetical protein WCJ47_04355, partial [Methanomicrobiales archaeon]